MSAEIDDANVSAFRAFMQEKKAKKSPTKADAEEFESRWLELVDQYGLTDQTFSLLCEGFRIGAAKPLFDYYKRSDSGSLPYLTLGSFSAIKENGQEIELRLYLSLFACELRDPTSADQIGFLIKKIPASSLNKDQKLSGNARQYVRGLVISELAGESIKADPQGVELPAKDIARFVKMISPLVKEVGENPKARVSERDAAASLLEWLNMLYEPEAQESLTEPMSLGGTKESSELEHEEEPAQNAPSDRLTADQIIAAIRNMDKRIESLKSAAMSADSEVARLKSQRDSLKDELARAQGSLGKSRAMAAAQAKEIDDLKAQIAFLQSELDANKQLVDLLDQTNAKQSDEAMKRIARKLKVEYQDYQDALEIEMDANLGENMRLQLGSVFQILLDNGFEL